MKRSREAEMAEILASDYCLMLLSRVGEGDDNNRSSSPSSPSRVFSCKTCNREFGSFQALGGHRTSHKKARGDSGREESPPAKAKAHECSICGLEFAIGQALGGHMRRHRNDAVKKSGTTREVCLDLNLGPRHHENMDLSLRLGLVL